MIEQKPEYITRQIRRLAREVGSLADNIDNHHERGKFYSELLKNKIFELYESNNQLLELLNEKPSSLPGKIETPVIKKEDDSRKFSVEKTIPEEVKEEPQVFVKEEVSNDAVSEKAVPEVEDYIETTEVTEEVVEETPIAEATEVVEDTTPEVETTSEEIVENIEPEPSQQSIEVENTNNIFQTTIKKEDTWLYNNMLAALEKTKKTGDIAERKQDQSLKSLRNSISISQKHEFISALFAGESNALKDAILKIEQMHNFDDAVVWMEQELSNQYNWKKNEKLSFEFTNLVRRRFL